MPQVNVEINGRSYRLSCGPGEEEHVIALSRRIDKHASSIGKASTPAAEIQSLVMAALMLADELEVEALQDVDGIVPPDYVVPRRSFLYLAST